MKLIEAGISILVGADRTVIELHDKTASIAFAKVVLTPEQLSAALSRLYSTPCEIEVTGLGYVGKRHEVTTFEFKLPPGTSYSMEKEAAKFEAAAQCPEGWIPDLRFGSHDSFFTCKGERWARTHIRRWVDVE